MIFPSYLTWIRFLLLSVLFIEVEWFWTNANSVFSWLPRVQHIPKLDLVSYTDHTDNNINNKINDGICFSL